MTVEQFKAALCERMDIHPILFVEPNETIQCTADEINIMTGGAFYRAIEKLDSNYEWPE